MKNKSEYEQLDIPKLGEDIKAMNGKSSRKLKECIENLQEVLKADEELKSKHRDQDETP